MRTGILGHVQPLKKSEMEEGVTYYLCPNKSCGGFWEDRLRCESGCPRVDEMKKILCFRDCDDLVILDGRHSLTQRVEYLSLDGRNSLYFRDGTVSQIIYEMPEK
jgi:hypothetical protein